LRGEREEPQESTPSLWLRKKKGKYFHSIKYKKKGGRTHEPEREREEKGKPTSSSSEREEGGGKSQNRPLIYSWEDQKNMTKFTERRRFCRTITSEKKKGS